MEPMIPMNSESELRHAVIDRLIAASLRDGASVREASLQHWRTMGMKQAAPGLQGVVSKNAPEH